jgi:hypothetical protein
VLAAYLWDEITALRRRAAKALAAQNQLAARDAAVPDDDVDEAANAWRYEHDLISADDLETWLSARELGLDEWLAYVRRSESLRRTSARIATPYAPPSDQVDDVLFAEAICDGTIAEVVEKLAGRAAAFERVRTQGPARTAAKATIVAALDRVPRAVRRDGLFGLSGSESIARARTIVEMDLGYARFVKTVATLPALEREIESHALAWTVLRCKTMTFGSQAPAREAALLIREDGLPIAKAATVAKTTVVSADVVLDDVDGTLSDRLVAAQPGDLVGPIETDDGFIVTLVTERVSPSAGDRQIRERAKELIERRTVGAEIDKRIRWHERF